MNSQKKELCGNTLDLQLKDLTWNVAHPTRASFDIVMCVD
jgi:hypothetical protein